MDVRAAVTIPPASEDVKGTLIANRWQQVFPMPDAVYYSGKMANPNRTLPNAAIFESALRRVLRVSKTDLNQMLAEEKRANQGKPKRGPKPKHRG